MKFLKCRPRGASFLRASSAMRVFGFSRIKPQLIALFGLLTAIVTFNAAALLSTVTLAWDPSPDATVTGYRVHYGIESNVLTATLDAGVANTLTVPNLAPGLIYYFTVTAYNSAGLESLDSNQVSSLTGSSLSPVQVKLQPNRQVVIMGLGQAGNIYTLQSSEDLTTWTTLGSVVAGLNGAYQFTDTAAPAFSARYYRATAILP